MHEGGNPTYYAQEKQKTTFFSNCFPTITIEPNHPDTRTAHLSDNLSANAVIGFSIRFAY